MASIASRPTVTQINQACSALQHILLFTDYSRTITEASDLYEQLGRQSTFLPAKITTMIGSSAQRASELLRMIPTDTMTKDDISGYRKNFLMTILPKTISALARDLLGEFQPHIEALTRGDTYINWKEVFSTSKRCWDTDPLHFGPFAGEKKELVQKVLEGSSAGLGVSDTDYAEVYEPARKALTTWIRKESG